MTEKARCGSCGVLVVTARTTGGTRALLLDYHPLGREFRTTGEILAGRYWLHDVGEDLPRARMLGPASPNEDLLKPRYRPHAETCDAPPGQLSLFGERDVEHAVALEPGDTVLDWDPAMKRWRRCEVLGLAPPEESTPSGRGLTIRTPTGKSTQYLGNFEERLGEGNRLLPKHRPGGQEYAESQAWRFYRRTERSD